MDVNITIPFIPEDDIISIISILSVLILSFIIYFLYYYFFGECINMDKNEGRDAYLGIFIYTCSSLISITVILIPLSFFIIYLNGYLIFITSLIIAGVFILGLIFYSAYIKRYKQDIF